MKAEVMSFRQDIAPLTAMTLTERVKDRGEVTEVRVRFYPGQERALQVRPFIQLFNSMTEDMFTWAGGSTDRFLSGDDDYLVFPVSATVVADDNIAVWVNNTDPNYTYTLVCDVVIQYYSGADSING
jgi:hypothetical protein